MLMSMDVIEMPGDLRKIFDSMIIELNNIVSGDIISITRQRIEISVKAVHQLRKYILDHPFDDLQSEIQFFKVFKPRFYAYYIYYSKVYQLEVLRPISNSEEEVTYFHEELKNLAEYFNRHRSFYEYMRMGSEFLDDKYFVRGLFNISQFIDTYNLDADPGFSSSHDYKVARILANRMLSDYVKKEIDALKKNSLTAPESFTDKESLTWTASKAALIELIYACQSLGTFNNGDVDIKDIADMFQRIFNVNLGNLYRTFQEIRIRKKGRTFFLDQLKDELIKRMDLSDENPR